VLAMSLGSPLAWMVALGVAAVFAVSAELKDRRR